MNILAVSLCNRINKEYKCTYNTTSFAGRTRKTRGTSPSDPNWVYSPISVISQKYTAREAIRLSRDALSKAQNIMQDDEAIGFDLGCGLRFFAKPDSDKPGNKITVEEKTTAYGIVLTVRDYHSNNQRIYEYIYKKNSENSEMILSSMKYTDTTVESNHIVENFSFYTDGKTLKTYSKQVGNPEEDRNKYYQYACFGQDGNLQTYCEDAIVDDSGNILETLRRIDY